jgi:hypothetical protein
MMNILYVVDERGKMVDDIRLRDVILNPLDRKVAEIMDNTFVSLHAADDQKKRCTPSNVTTASRSGRGRHVLVGIVTVDDILTSKAGSHRGHPEDRWCRGPWKHRTWKWVSEPARGRRFASCSWASL